MLGTKRIHIYMHCPGCLRDYGCAENEYWIHGDRCEGKLLLDEYANVICSKCGAHWPLTKMRLSCNSGRHIVFYPGVLDYAKSISCAAAFTNEMGIDWLQNVLRWLKT